MMPRPILRPVDGKLTLLAAALPVVQMSPLVAAATMSV
jgi:hypothetical protein